MKLAKLMDGKTPYITNLTVYSASAISDGAFMTVDQGSAITNVGTTVTVGTGSANVANFKGCTTLSSSFGSAAQENLALGGQSFNIDTDGLPDRGISTGGSDFLPVLISPAITWFGLYTGTSGAATAGTNLHSFTASNTTNVVGTIIGDSSAAGGWIYSLSSVSTGTATFSGQLRQVSNSAATTSLTMVTAWQVSTDTEAILTYSPAAVKCSFNLKSGTASEFGSIAASAAVNTAATNLGAAMQVVASCIQHDAAPFHRLTQRVDDGLDGVTNGKVFSEVVFLDNYWT